jgi:hypothetical protein
MLPDDSYLRRLPGALDPIERLRFESIVFSSDVVSNAYQALCELAGANLTFPIHFPRGSGPRYSAMPGRLLTSYMFYDNSFSQ